jgi:hypothetical protein
MRAILVIASVVVSLCINTDSIVALSQQQQFHETNRVDGTRKAFFRQIPIAIAAFTTIDVVTGSLIIPHTKQHDCSCSSCSINSRVTAAFAYERRDVGGDNPSPEMAAMNLQAFETMNRLEKDGVKLEVRLIRVEYSS